MVKSQFETFLAEEVQKVKGIYYPVKAGFFRQVFVKKMSLKKLHPNPNDEFCLPQIGPNPEIMARYKQAYLDIGKELDNLKYLQSPAAEPLIIERTRPDGYRILNGHHRWGGALQAGMTSLPVKIVDLTQESDVKKMLRNAGFNRRVTLDLDEVVFRPADDPFLEKPLRFPLNRFYKERLRLGIPALFHWLNGNGYDIWIYTAGFYSLEYLRRYFRHYRVHVTGIVTGTARKTATGADTRKRLDQLMENQYQSALHIDNEMILRTFKGSREFDEFHLESSSDVWSRNVINAMEAMEKA